MAQLDHFDASQQKAEGHERVFDIRHSPSVETGSGTTRAHENATPAHTETLVKIGTLPRLDLNDQAAEAVTSSLAYDAHHHPGLLAINTGLALAGQPIPLLTEAASSRKMVNQADSDLSDVVAMTDSVVCKSMTPYIFALGGGRAGSWHCKN